VELNQESYTYTQRKNTDVGEKEQRIKKTSSRKVRKNQGVEATATQVRRMPGIRRRARHAAETAVLKGVISPTQKEKKN